MPESQKKTGDQAQPIPPGEMDTEITDLGPRSRLDKLINGALLAASHAHGPITPSNISSATKRVVGAIKQYNRDLVQTNSLRQPEYSRLSLDDEAIRHRIPFVSPSRSRSDLSRFVAN